MNTDQFLSIVRTVMKIVSGILIAHGLQGTADMINSADVTGSILLIVSCLWSHFNHGSDTNSGNAALKLLLALALPALLLTGCKTDLNHVAFKTEYAAAASCDAAMTGYAAYWKKAIQSPTNFNRTTAGLNDERKKISDDSIKIGGAIELAEKLRVSYATNSAVKPQLESALTSLSVNAAGIVATASTFLTSTNK